MRQLVLGLVLVATIYLEWVDPVSGINCTVNGDCNATTVCSGGTIAPICQHPDGSVVANGGVCTCPSGGGGCVLARDCYGSNAVLDCDDSARHCYDGRCICSQFPIGRK